MIRRRNLRLPSSSDEDDSPPRPQALATPSTNPRDNPPPPQSDPLEDDSSPRPQALATPSPKPRDNPPPPKNASPEISDDEFMDVEDALSEHSPPPVSAQSAGVTPDGVGASADDLSGASVGAIDEFLRRMGLGLRQEWLASCFSRLVDAVPGFEELDVARKARLCFEHFLLDDMNYCGAGILPENVHCMHKVDLEGPFVLQVDEVTNTSFPLQERYHDSPAGLKRCLKLSLTDGVQLVFAMEYRPVQDLKVLSPAGVKIIIQNVQIRRGLLLLLPEVVEVLGGLVEDLDAARQRLINEVNKPPRGKRKHALVPLSQRATLAAWPSITINSNERNTSVSGSNINNNGLQANNSVQQTLSNPQIVVKDFANVTIMSDTSIKGLYVEEYVDPNTGRINSEDAVSRDNGRDIYGGPVSARESFAKVPDYNSSLNAESNVASDAEHVQDFHDDAVNELNNPIILNGEKEIPFTYLASLLAKWVIVKDKTSSIQGRIKCILTGVKMFQFKHQSTYKLLVYVDDGSYISEVFIDHSVVQNGIGYSSKDVSASLSSSDKKIKADMTDRMKKFQLFLANFEGTMLVEINKDSSLPVGLEMSQGCLASDAWLLLRRLKSFTSKIPQHHSIEPIILSP